MKIVSDKCCITNIREFHISSTVLLDRLAICKLNDKSKRILSSMEAASSKGSVIPFDSPAMKSTYTVQYSFNSNVHDLLYNVFSTWIWKLTSCTKLPVNTKGIFFIKLSFCFVFLLFRFLKNTVIQVPIINCTKRTTTGCLLNLKTKADKQKSVKYDIIK